MGLLLRGLVIFSLAGTAAYAQLTPALQSYTTCKFDDGLAVVQVSALPKGVQGRTVDTLTGTASVAIDRGERVMFAYPGMDFYANVKVEQLAAKNYAEGKAALISNFDHILASGNDSARNYKLRPTLNGFEIYGLDRTTLDGGTLGIYLMLDDTSRIATTMYFLNQEPSQRKFATLEEYTALRDHFLNAYTSCVHARPAKAAPAAISKKKRR